MNSSGTRYCHNVVVVVRASSLRLKFLGLASAEVISGAHDVSPMCKSLHIHAREHVKHFSCMSTASKDNQEVDRRVFRAAFEDRAIVGDFKRKEYDLRVEG
jgi:hypothetical protein